MADGDEIGVAIEFELHRAARAARTMLLGHVSLLPVRSATPVEMGRIGRRPRSPQLVIGGEDGQASLQRLIGARAHTQSVRILHIDVPLRDNPDEHSVAESSWTLSAGLWPKHYRGDPIMKTLLSAALIAGALAATPAAAAPIVYGTAAAFGAATTGVTTNGFENAANGTSNYILASGSYSQPGFTITQSTNNAFNTSADFGNSAYYYSWGSGDVINTPHNGVMTITFASAVTAFALDLGSFYDDQNPATPCCAASTFYGKDVIIGTSQGNFLVDLNSTQTLKFFGVTSETAFTSFTITGATTDPTASTIVDNLRFGSAAAAAVPEPATWAMMISGFGLVGGAMRRRASKPTLAYAA
jgi:hypothetical protein